MSLRPATCFGLLLAACAGAPEPSRTPDPFAAVRFLSGTWRSETKGEVNEEAWAEPAGATMHGVNRSTRAGKLAAFELLCLYLEGDALDYEASHGPGRSTRFRLVASAPGTATFTNPEHDFPKRILYVRTGEAMHAVVDAGDGSTQRLEFHWQRVPDANEGR